MVKSISNPFKEMYKGTTHNLDRDGMHRPEGSGNFDNMDDEIILDIIVVSPDEPKRKKEGLLWWDADATGQSISSTVNIVTKTSTYTLVNTDVIVLGDGTFTLTLPTAVGIAGKIYYTKNIGTGTITIDGDGTETIDEATTAVISSQFASITIVSDGSNWHII